MNLESIKFSRVNKSVAKELMDKFPSSSFFDITFIQVKVYECLEKIEYGNIDIKFYNLSS
jgi:hypothetical protein